LGAVLCVVVDVAGFVLFLYVLAIWYREFVIGSRAVLIVLGLGFFRNRIPLACAEGK